MNLKSVWLCSGGPSTSAKQLTEDFRTVLKDCSKPAPRVAYIGTANLDNASFFHHMQDAIMGAGASETIMVPLAKNGADIPAAKNILSQADAIFLSGGEVEDGMLWLKKAGLDKYLTELYYAGKTFFGVSAGCIMMGQHWVHWETENDDSTASLFDCLDFVPFTFDAHGENEDWSELKCALRLLGPDSEGFGLTNGGFFTAGSNGQFISFRNSPAIYHNLNGSIEIAE